MRIKILRTIGKKDTMPRGPDNPTSQELPAKPDGTMYQEGEVILNATDEQADKLIRSGVGESVEAQPIARQQPTRQQPTPHEETKQPEAKAGEKK